MTSASGPPSRPPPKLYPSGAAGLTAFAVGLLLIPSVHFRLDRTICAVWPSRALGYTDGLVYVTAIAILAWLWRNSRWALSAIVAHLIALYSTPFLSSDPLMYAAVGRALAGGAAPSVSVSAALGADHPFLVPLPAAWRLGTSAYGPAWNALARLIGTIAGDDLPRTLHLHQGVACASILLAATIVAGIARDRAAFSLVALCPLAIVEATIGAHNDALLVPLVAIAIGAWLRGRWAISVGALALGLLWKASAAIFLGPVVLAMIFARLPSDRARRIAYGLVVACSVAGLGALALLHDGPLDALARIVGKPEVAYDHCTRSLECLPRVIFRFVLHWPTAAWMTGLCFRAIGIAWLGWQALRAAEADRDDRRAPLSILVRGIFIYFLLLHGWAQSWYALPLLPALPFLIEDLAAAAALRTYLVTSVLYYALVLPMSCLVDPVAIAVSDLIEASVTVFPPVVVMLRARKSAA